MAEDREIRTPAPRASGPASPGTRRPRATAPLRPSRGAPLAARVGDRRAARGHGHVPVWLEAAGGWSWRVLTIAAVVALVFWATTQVQLVFAAVFLSLVITAVLRPLVDLIARVVPRPAAVGLALLTALLVVAGLLTYVVTSVAGQWDSLNEQFSAGVGQIFDFLENGRLPFSFTHEDFDDWVQDVTTWVQTHASSIAGEAASRAVVVLEVFTAIELAVFCAIFFLARGRGMWEWFLGQLPARMRATWDDVAGAGWEAFAGYTRGTVIIALSDGLLAAAFLALAGVPLAAPLAVLVLLGAFVPLVGAPAAMLVAMVVALAANGIVNAAVVGIGIALIGQFEGHVLQPLVMGRQVSLHPVVVAVVVAGGTLVAGILGAVVAVPLAGVTWAVFGRLRQHHLPPDDED